MCGFLFMVEKWADIKGYEGSYQVSNLGGVRSLNKITKTKKGERFYKGKLLKPFIDKKTKYTIYGLSLNGEVTNMRAHVLVAIGFLNHVPSKFNKVVDHIDGNPMNNSLFNLQIISHRENISKSKSNNLEYTGICYHIRHEKYICNIMVNKKMIHLGYFNDKEQAKIVRDKYKSENQIL